MRLRCQSALLVIALLSSSSLCGQEFELSPQHQRINFLAGSWSTESRYPETGLVAPGELEYRWVLGGSWLKITFFGNHPERPVWQAHGMMRWNAERGTYESILYFDENGPTTLDGEIVDGTTLRISYPGGSSGIDYSPTPEGAVFQENWAIDQEMGLRRTTLRTSYTAN